MITAAEKVTLFPWQTGLALAIMEIETGLDGVMEIVANEEKSD